VLILGLAETGNEAGGPRASRHTIGTGMAFLLATRALEQPLAIRQSAMPQSLLKNAKIEDTVITAFFHANSGMLLLVESTRLKPAHRFFLR